MGDSIKQWTVVMLDTNILVDFLLVQWKEDKRTGGERVNEWYERVSKKEAE